MFSLLRDQHNFQITPENLCKAKTVQVAIFLTVGLVLTFPVRISEVSSSLFHLISSSSLLSSQCLGQRYHNVAQQAVDDAFCLHA